MDWDPRSRRIPKTSGRAGELVAKRKKAASEDPDSPIPVWSERASGEAGAIVVLLSRRSPNLK